MVSPYREQGTLGISHLLLSVTPPVTVGNPVNGKRERLLSLTLAYNLSNGQIGLLFDLIKYDFYVVGTYKTTASRSLPGPSSCQLVSGVDLLQKRPP